MHGLKLTFFSLRFFFQSLDGLLESFSHLFLEVLGRGRIFFPHVLVLFFQVGPVLHHLRNLASMMFFKSPLSLFVGIMLLPGVIMREIGISGWRLTSCGGGGGCRTACSLLLREMDGNLNISKFLVIVNLL